MLRKWRNSVKVPVSRLRLSILPEYNLPFTGVIGVGSPAGAWWGDRQTVPNAVSGQCQDPIHRHSGWWHARNVATGGARPMKRNGRSARSRRDGKWPPLPPSPIGRRWTIGRRRGRMGAQNGGQRPGLQRRGTPVKTQAWSATGGRVHWPAPRHRVRETPGPPSDAARRSAESQCSFLFPIEARSVLVSLVVCQCVASKPSTQIAWIQHSRGWIVS